MGFDPEQLIDAFATIERALAQPLDAAVPEITSALLDIFACERAWLRSLGTNEGLFEPSVSSRGPAQALDDDAFTTELLRRAGAGEVVVCGAGGLAIPAGSRWAALGVRAALFGVFTPRLGPRIVLGLHYVSDRDSDRTRAIEARLFAQIGARVAGAVTLAAALQHLRWSEAQVRVLLEHAGEALVIVDVGTQRIVDANNKAEQLVGWPSGHLLGSELTQLCLEPSEQLAVRLAAVVTGEPQRDPWSVRRVEGPPLVCDVELVAIPNPDRLLVCACIRPRTRRDT